MLEVVVGGITFLELTGANFTFDILLFLPLLVITGTILDFNFLMDLQYNLLLCPGPDVRAGDCALDCVGITNLCAGGNCDVLSAVKNSWHACGVRVSSGL